MVLGTEFGRTPRINGNDGRGHHNKAFNCMLADLQAKWRLEQTLVVLGTEFGRTPKINDDDGPNHHNCAFT